jgi:hypothetical protein
MHIYMKGNIGWRHSVIPDSMAIITMCCYEGAENVLPTVPHTSNMDLQLHKHVIKNALHWQYSQNKFLPG